MDIEAYRLRKKKTVAELAEMLGVSEAAIYNYKYKKSKPSYESIEKMLLDGAFLNEVFDEKVLEKVKEIHSIGVLNPEFKEGMELAKKPMTREEVIALFKLMKERGEI